MSDTTVTSPAKSTATKADQALRGRFLWYELLTTDPEAAIPFYNAVIGWNPAPFEGGAMPYTFWLKGATPDTMVGGLVELPAEVRTAGAPPHWLAYIGTPDVDRTIERARALGAQLILDPEDIPTVGRIAVLKDPQGAVFAVYTPETEKPEVTPQHGDFSWHELPTTDGVAAFAFYQDLFGWDATTAMDMGPAGVYQIYACRGRDLGGIFTRSADLPGPPSWLYYILVDDVNKGIETVKALGGKLLNGPMEVPGGDWVAVCMDPQGAAFALHHQRK